MAEFYEHQSNYHKALLHNKRFYELARKADSAVEEQRALNQIGNSYYEIGMGGELHCNVYEVVCMYVYICMYVCMYVMYGYMCMYMCMYCMYVCIMYVCMYVDSCKYIYIYI